MEPQLNSQSGGIGRVAAEQADGALDESVARTAAEDPLARFLIQHWQRILVVIGACVALFFAVSMFQDAARRRVESASDALLQTRSRLEELQSLQAKYDAEQDPGKRDELKKGVDEALRKLNFSAVTLSDSVGIYKELAPLYQGIAARAAGDRVAALAALGASQAWESKPVGSSTRFAAELSALTRAGIMLDDEGSYAEGRALLTALAQKGEVVAVSAALSLAETSSSIEEQQAARSVLEELSRRVPESSSRIEPELKRLAPRQ